MSKSKKIKHSLFLGMGVISALSSGIYWSKLLNSHLPLTASTEGLCQISSRDLASIKNLKIEHKELKEINISLVTMDQNLERLKKQKEDITSNLNQLSEQLKQKKEQVEKIKKDPSEKSFKLGLSISGMENDLNYVPDAAVQKAVKDEYKYKPLTDIQKKGLKDKIEKSKEEKKALDEIVQQSNLVLENIENLGLDIEQVSTTMAKEQESASNDKSNEKESDKKGPQSFEELRQELCNRDKRIKNLEQQIEEHLKDKEEIARIASKNNGSEGQIGSLNSGPNLAMLNQMMMMYQSMSMMQQMPWAFTPMNFMLNSNPYLNSGMYHYGGVPFSMGPESLLNNQLGQGVFGKHSSFYGLNQYGPVQNHFYNNQQLSGAPMSYSPFENNYYGQGPLNYHAPNSQFLGGQMPLGARSQVGNAGFFEFGRKL